MTLHVYLNFPGNAIDALRYYEDVFDTKAEVTTFAEIPDDPNFKVSEEARNKVMHASMKIADSILMLSDSPPEMGEVKQGNNFSIALVLNDRAKLKEYFERLSKDGQVIMPLGETFWSKMFGTVTDVFGIDWMFDLGE